MLLECACGKMYRVRSDSGTVPNKCPACGGPLKPTGTGGGGPEAPPAAAPTPGGDPRMKELEFRIQQLDKGQAADRAELERREKELEKSQGRIAELEGEVRTLRAAQEKAPVAAPPPSAMDRVRLELKEKELAEAQGRVAELEDSVREAEAAREIAQKELELARTGTEMKVKSLQSQLEKAREAITKSEDLRREMDSLKEKESVLRQQEESLAAYKAQVEEFGKRAADVEKLRNEQREACEAGVRAREAMKTRMEEARHMAGDVDRSLESVSSSLQGLRMRVERMMESLVVTGKEEPPDVPKPAPAPASEEPLFKAESAPPPQEEKAALPLLARGSGEDTMLDFSRLRRKQQEAEAARQAIVEEPPPPPPPPAQEETGEVPPPEPAPEPPPAEPPPAIETFSEPSTLPQAEFVPAAEEPPAAEPPPPEPAQGETGKRSFFTKLFKKK